MLMKGAIIVFDPKQNQFLSSLFLAKKKDGGNRPVDNLKDLNSNIPYQHFKMEGLFLLKEMLLPGGKMCKIDLKDGYFAIPLSPVSEIQDVCQIPVEKPSVQVLLPLLQTFSCSSGLYKVIKSPYLSLEKTQYKNNNLP